MDQSLGSDPEAPTKLDTPERNQYYYGKLLDVSHFALEQNYLNSKRWLLSRLLDGAGVVCGLAVSVAANGTQLIIGPGVAIDGWGREIIVPAGSLSFDPRTLTDDSGKPAGTVSGASTVTISICYQECGAGPEPVLVASCKPEGGCAPSLTLEQFVVVVKQGVALPSPLSCGFTDLFKPPAGSNVVPDIHPKLAGRVTQQCTAPSGTGCVLLAQISLPAAGNITAAMIDNTVRPVVVSNAVLLELVFCLAQRVQQLAPAPTPTPTPTPTAHLLGPMPTPSSAPGRKPAPTPKPTRQS